MKRDLAMVLLAVCLLLCLGAGCTAGSDAEGFDWPAWRGPEADGISKESGWNPAALAGEPKLLWQADAGVGYASVAIRDGLLVSMGAKDGYVTVFGLKADTGKQVWVYKEEGYDDSQATPAIDGDSAYALSREGQLFCLNRKNGRLRWKKDLVKDFGVLKPYYGFAGSPVIHEDLVILTANTAGLALNRKTGEKAWVSEPPPKVFKASDKRDTNGADYATPVLYQRQGNSYALIASCQGVSSMAVQTGQRLWVYEWELYSGRHVSDPVVAGDRIFIAQNSNLGYQAAPGSLLLDAGGGEPELLWRSPELATEISTPVALDGYLYCGQGGPYLGGASLRCLELNTGGLMWEKKLSAAYSPKCVSVAAADGKLLVLTDDGLLTVAEASPEGYQEISRCALLPEVKPAMKKFWTPPVLCNGRIYCRNYGGQLVCIDVGR